MAGRFKFKPAKRADSQITVGLYGPSGCGKTYGGLLLARGIVGPEGVIGLADADNGRGSLFADIAEIGGYSYIRVDPPFEPATFIEAIDAAAKDGVDILVIDPLSMVWNGPGGVVDQANARQEKSGKAGLQNWNKPKQDLAKLQLHLLGAKMHFICTLRAKRKTRQAGKGDSATVVKDPFYSPKMEDDFISDMLAFAEVLGKDDPRGSQYSLRVGKHTHPGVAAFFKDGAIPSVAMGQLFSKWSAKTLKDSDVRAVEKKQAESTRQAAPASDDLPPWSPAEGWRKDFSTIGEWQTWSAAWLEKNGNRMTADGWRRTYDDAWKKLEGLANKKGENQSAYADRLALLRGLYNKAMKKEPGE